MLEEASVNETIGFMLPSSSNVRLQSEEEITKKLQQMRQQISSSSCLQTLKTEIDAAIEVLNLAADNALLRANGRLTLIAKQETADLEKVARKVVEYSEKFKRLERDSEHIRGCGNLNILLEYRKRARAVIKGVKGIEDITAVLASSLRLLSISNDFKLLSARLKSTRLVYATSDDVDEDWRRDALRPFSVEKGGVVVPWSEEAAGNQTADLAGWLKESSATAKENHGVDASLHRGNVDTGYRVFFTGMKANIKEPDLREAFSVFGHVGEIQRFLLPDGVHTSGQGFVTLDSLSAANSALAASPISIRTSRIIMSRLEALKEPTLTVAVRRRRRKDEAACSRETAGAQVTKSTGCSREASSPAKRGRLTFPAEAPSKMPMIVQKRPNMLPPPLPPPPLKKIGTSLQSCEDEIRYRVFFKSLEANIVEPKLRNAFSVFGHVGEIRRFLLPDGVHASGEGFVTFDSLTAAKSALAASRIFIGAARIKMLRMEKSKLTCQSTSAAFQ
uniref:RRM domain-containing protein n=1 Tax=Mesocestoides corti TaxID=53468 RepID=A0A5K3FMU0_MESCO